MICVGGKWTHLHARKVGILHLWHIAINPPKLTNFLTLSVAPFFCYFLGSSTYRYVIRMFVHLLSREFGQAYPPFQSTSDWLLLSLLTCPIEVLESHGEVIMNPDYANPTSSSSISLLDPVMSNHLSRFVIPRKGHFQNNFCFLSR